MEEQLKGSYLLIFILSCFIRATETTSANDTLSEVRQPRVIGRIVKLYSGAHPEPVYCAQEGFQADPVHCAIFYRCVRAASGRYTVYRFQCGPGTIYDPDVETCNFPQLTKRNNCGGNGPERFQAELPRLAPVSPELPSPISTKPFYASSFSDSTQKTLTTIIYPWITTPSQKLQTPLQSASTMNVWTTAKPQIFPSSQKRQVGDPCTKDGFMGDSEDCRKFYRCVGNQRGGFVRYEFSCSESTVWDEDAQNCNHAWAVQRTRCGRTHTNFEKVHTQPNDQTKNNTKSPNTIQEQLQINYGHKISQSQTQISHGSVKQNQTQINYGNRNNTDQTSQPKQNQTQISYGSAISQTQTQINQGENAVQTQLQIDHTKDSSQSQTTLSNVDHDNSDQGYGSQPAETSNTDQLSNEGHEDNKCTESGFMGDRKDCRKFYRCVDNGRGGFIKYDFTCGEGTVWDSSVESCNHAWAVPQCGGTSNQNLSLQETQTTTTLRPTESHQTTTETATTNDYDDPGSGYGNQHQQQGPTSTSTTSTSTSSTSTTKQPQTSTKPSENNECKESGFMGDKNDCKKFYRCVDNGNGGYTRFEFTCGEGTLWDPKIEACNHAWAVEKCGGDGSDIHKETTSSARPTTNDEVFETSSESESGYPGQPSAGPEYTEHTETTSKPTEQTSTKKPVSETVCSQEGFMGDKEDCKKFYRCVDNGQGGFIVYEFSCGEGTIWDSEITACNHPNSVKRSCSGETSNQSTNVTERPQGTSTSSSTQATSATESTTTENTSTTKPSLDTECSQEGFMGDNNDCKKFYRCLDNGKGGFIKYEFSCGEGTVWDPELNTCNHPSPDKTCGGTNSHEAIISTEPERQDDEMYTESTSSHTTVKSTTEQSTEKPQSSSEKCISEGFYGDSTDCKKFYRCVDDGNGGFIKYEFTCGDGTIWNQDLQTCDHPSSNSNCSTGSSNEAQTSQSTSGTTEGSSTEGEDHSTPKPQSPQNVSQGKCTSEGFYANPDDCKKFYRCVDNGNGGYTKYDFNCGEGTIWVQEIQACDHDTGHTCSASLSESSIKPDEGTKPTEAATHSPDKQEDEKPDESPSSNNISDNDEKCTSEGFYANKDDCRKFFRCVDNGNGGFIRYDFTCGEGTAWDSNAQTCNHIDQVESCQGQEHQSDTELDESTTSSSNDTTSTTQSPASEGSSTESSKPTSNDKCEKEGYYGNSQDCKKFYRCVDNGKGGFTKYDFDCGEGTIWDQDVQTCNHPQDVANPSCQQSAGMESSSSTSSSVTGSSSSSSSGTTSSTTEGGSGSDCSTKKPANKKVNCTKAGYYPDPDDCKKFYRCVDWDGNGEKFSVYHFECGEGTIWDPALDTCNHEDSVYPPRDCSGTQSQSENVGEETTTSQSSNTDSTTKQSTTQQSTTEQTTTEQTITEESTTSAPTTQSSEKTTTEQSTEGTTTQGTTEKTTTQKSTTSQQTEQTTMEQTEKTTTQETTTQKTEGTTTQQSTTEQSTSTTTEQLQQTTEQTTQESTTSESTTEQSTTEQSTTQQTTEGTTQESTTEQSTIAQTDDSGTTDSSTSTTEESTTESGGTTETTDSSSEKECPETEDDQNLFVCPTSFKRHPKYCNMFYQCTEDDDTHDVQIATFRCPNETIYDESQTKCVEEKKAEKKCDGEMAQKRRIKRFDIAYKEPITISSERLKCPALGHYPFEKENCSPAFLKCEKNKSGKLRGYVYQCPLNYVYWSVSRRCEHKEQVRDCKKSHNDWSGRWEIPIERRNVAP